MKTELIELLRQAFQLGQQWVHDINNGDDPENFNSWVEKQSLTEQESKVSAEGYKTQLIVPIVLKNKEYQDYNGKVIPIEFIKDKDFFCYGSDGYIVLQDNVQQNSDAVELLHNEIKQLKYMIDNGLGWEDMINDIKYPNEL